MIDICYLDERPRVTGNLAILYKMYYSAAKPSSRLYYYHNEHTYIGNDVSIVSWGWLRHVSILINNMIYLEERKKTTNVWKASNV